MLYKKLEIQIIAGHLGHSLSQWGKIIQSGSLATTQKHFNFDIYVFGKIFYFAFSRKITRTRKTISLNFTTVMSFDLLCKRNNNNDGFYCKG